MVDPTDPAGTPEQPPSVSAETTLRTGAGTPTIARVLVTNRAPAARSMAITAMGADAAWLPAPSQSRVLAPGETILAELRLAPAVGTLPARYPIAVAVQALDPGTGQATAPTVIAELSLVVDAPGQVGIDLTPTDVRAVFGKKITVALSNSGGAPADVRLDTQASESAPVRLDHTQVRLQGGERREVSGRVRVRRARLLGHKTRHAFSVTARSGGAPVHVEGSLTARAMLGPGGTKFTVLAAVVAVWVALAIVFIPKLASSIKDGHTITAKSVQTVAPTGSASGGSGKGGSSGSEPGPANGGHGAPKSGGAGAAKNATSAAKTLQLNGTVQGTAPAGVDVVLAPTTLVDEDILDAKTVGVDAHQFRALGKIPAAALSAPTPQDEPSSTAMTTTKDGTWSFPAVHTPGYYLLTFAKPGYQTMRYVVNAASAAAQKPLTVTLVPGEGRLSGTVHGPGGRVDGAAITITDGTNTLTTSSNSRGHVGEWSVSGLSTPSTYLVQASKPGLGTESALIHLDAGGKASVELTLHRGVSSLIGKVSGDDGPIGGATVTATNGAITRTATTITSGAVGRYVLPDLPAPGTYTVTLSADGYQPQTEQVHLSRTQPSRTVNATLTSSNATINGAVTSVGKPVSGAGLVLRSNTTTYKLTSTNQGRFSFTGVAPGTYVLSAQYFGLLTGYVTVVASPGQTLNKTIVLRHAPTALSHSTVTGFVGDGANPSNTLCASSKSSACTVSFVLCKATPGDHGRCGANPSTWVSLGANGGPVSTNPSISPPAPSGPTAYTLSPDKSASLPPGLYHLTITVTDANSKQTGISYLPATVNVQVPFDGVAHAPQVSLYSAGSIAGTISSEYDWTGSGAKACVWAVPIGTAAPKDRDCTPPSTTAGCSATGLASPSVAQLHDSGGAYTVAGLCNGTYQMYVRTTNPDFTWVTPAPPVVITVLNGSSGAFNSSLLRLGRFQLQLVYASGSSSTPVALADTDLDTGSQCAPVGTIPGQSVVDLSNATTDDTGNVIMPDGQVVHGLQPGIYTCTVKAVTKPPSNLNVSATTNWIFTNFNTTTPVPVTLAVTVNTFIGQVVSSVSGTSKGVGGVPVNVSGTIGFDAAGNKIIGKATVITDGNGCFAIRPISDPSSPKPATGPCTGSTAIPTAPLDLKAPTADFVITASDAEALGYQGQTKSGVTVTSITPDNPVQLQLFPNPVAFGGNITALPLGVPMSAVKAVVRDQPGGTGTITTTVNSDGSISWADPNASGGQILPGNYTIEFSGTGLAPWQYRFQCTILVQCSPTFDLSANGLGTLILAGSSTTPLADDSVVAVLNNGTTVGSPHSTSGGGTSFPDLLPSVGYKSKPANPSAGDSWATYAQPVYTVKVQAAGYRFGTSGAADGYVTVGCGSTSPNLISLPVTSRYTLSILSCDVTLTPDGSISGTLTGIDAKYDSSNPDPTGGHKLNRTRVTAQACDPDTVNTTKRTCTVTGPVFSDTTDLNGEYTITGTPTDQGLDPGYWLVTTDSDKYGDTDGSGKQPHRLVQVPASGAIAVQNIDFTLYVTLVGTFTVTINDQNRNPLIKPLVAAVTMTLSGGGPVLTATLNTADKDYVFTDVVPGDYDITATGTQFSKTTDNGVAVQPDHVSHTVDVTLHSNTVSGTVSGQQGSAAGVTALNGVLVQLGTVDEDGTFTVATNVSGDAKLTAKTAADSPGTFSITGVPDSGPGGWTLRLSRPGYTTTPHTLIVDPSHVQQGLAYTLPRITHAVTVTIDASTASDSLDGISDVKLVAASGTGDYAPASNANQTPTGTDTSTAGEAVASFAQVPFGCWRLAVKLADHHFGTLSLTTAPSADTNLKCPSGSITVPSTGTGEIDATYSLDESKLDVSLDAAPSTKPDGSIDDVPAMSVKVADSDTTYYSSDSWTDGSSVTLWLPPTAPSGRYTASVHPADSTKATAWPAPDDTKSSTVPASGKFNLKISELAQLGVTVDGASSTGEAAVTVAPGTDQAEDPPTAYDDPVATIDGALTLFLPDGNWNVTGTLGTEPNAQRATKPVDLSTDQANTTTLTPTWASIKVQVADASTATTASVTLTCLDSQTQPSGCNAASGGITGTDDGTGTTIANNLAAGKWRVTVTLGAAPDIRAVTTDVTLNPGQAKTLQPTPRWSSLTVKVPGADKTLATVKLTCTGGQHYPADCDTTPVKATDSGSGAKLTGLAPGTWSITATIGPSGKKKTYTGSVTLKAGLDGDGGEGEPFTALTETP